jgi:uncharacterized protein
MNQPKGLHVLAKPVGPKCNLNCEYCFYLEKHALFNGSVGRVMSDDVLDAYTTKYIASQPSDTVQFVWQGGEPMLAGLDFYQRALEYQQPFINQKMIKNSLQTNGTLLDDEWCRFLKENDFLVGLSLDGPKEIHDRYRKDHNGKGSFDQVMRSLGLLRKHGVELNIMATVGRETACRPLEVYRFFKEQGVEYIQFTPVIERQAGAHEKNQGLKLAGLASVSDMEAPEVTRWSVEPESYGNFMIAIFDEWIRNDVGKIFVMNFEWALNAWLGNSSPSCHHARQCGTAILLEHNGDVFACDHCVYPEYKLGNILEDDPVMMVQQSMSTGFGDKEANLPLACLDCEVLNACWGGCPKYRFGTTRFGDKGQYYLCDSNKRFLKYIRKYLHGMAQLIENDLPVSLIMQAIDGPLVIDKSKFNK